ncbi:MAG: hypothetical protein DRN20_02140 [Thermoplasmata archaeon]|nr:MAG: hypothetical protein DRN20_02140 [Thermoplasmata archaeon]
MEAHEMMFELSHPNRIKIMKMLKEKPLKLTGVARKLDVTPAEAARHLRRLTAAQMVSKSEDQRYFLTPLGKVLLEYIERLEFYIENTEYFVNHDISVLPAEFIWSRNIVEGKVVKGTLEILSLIKDLSDEAEAEINIISDEVYDALVPLNLEKAGKGVKIRIIYPEGVKVPKDYVSAKNIEVRFLKEVPISLKRNEKRGGIVLPKITGQIDYSHALMGDTEFNDWLRRVFNYYWEKAGTARR